MTTKTGKYSGDQLYDTIYRDKDPTTVHFMYFPHHKVEATQVLNGMTYIISEELLIHPDDLITISGIEREPLWVFGINTSVTSLTQMSYIIRKQWKAYFKALVSRNSIYISTHKLH